MPSRLVLVLAAVLALFGIFVATRPSAYRFQRSTLIAVKPDDVYRHLEHLEEWPRWSPWQDVDSEIKRTFHGPSRGAGASFTWQGDDAQVGRGVLVISQASPPVKIRYSMELAQPWRATLLHDLSIAPRPQGSQVTWVLSGQLNFWAKLFTLFGDADARVGADLERGLRKLKAWVERGE